MLVGVTVFFYGIGVGVYRWYPYQVVRSLKRATGVALYTDSLKRSDGLYQVAFAEPLPPGRQILPPIRNIQGISDAISSLIVPVDAFWTAYRDLELVANSTLVLDGGATRVLDVTYRLAGRQYHAYAYIAFGSQRAPAAALIIPGSGDNQAWPMLRGDPGNYQSGIVPALGAYDRYVQIKPNHDCLAFHNGEARLSGLFMFNWLLNSGGSYAASYITDSLALAKYLRGAYDRIAVAGLSQGGYATLISSLQSQPDVAIVASGFSVTFETVEWAGQDQIVIPGMHQRLSNESIRTTISQSRTHFLLTYGTGESDYYKMEAEEAPTAKYFSGIPNVEVKVHNGRHTFPVDVIEEFIGRVWPASDAAREGTFDDGRHEQTPSVRR